MGRSTNGSGRREVPGIKRTWIKVALEAPGEPVVVELETPVVIPLGYLHHAVHAMPNDTAINVMTGPLAGMVWFKRDFWTGYVVGDYEPNVQQAIREVTRGGDVFYDIGCMHGFHGFLGLFCSGTSGKCIMFDPRLDNVTLAKKITEANGLTPFVVVENLAVSDENGVGEFHFDAADQAWGKLAESKPTDTTHWSPEKYPVGREKVTKVSLDTYVYEKGHPVPDVLKVDTEGAELAILLGASRLIAERRPGWVISGHSQDLYKGCKEFLLDAGYPEGDVIEWTAPSDILVARPRREPPVDAGSKSVALAQPGSGSQPKRDPKLRRSVALP